MKKTIFMEKYPTFAFEIQKSETTYNSVDAIIEHLKELIQADPIAVYITTFDHYAHTSSLEGGVVNPDIKDAKNIIFCFGKQLPSTTMLAVRPRTIGIAELENSFIVELLEVPNEQMHQVVETWIKSIAKSAA